MSESSSGQDSEFATAVERIYYNRLHLDISKIRARLADRTSHPPLDEIHQSLMDYAVSKAEASTGGTGFRQMQGAEELSSRLMRVLARSVGSSIAGQGL